MALVLEEEERVEEEQGEHEGRESLVRASREDWTCTVCTKSNDALDKKCQVCARPRGFLGVDARLPFHPPCKTYEGASKLLDARKIAAFLEAGVDPDLQDSDGWTGLHWAVALARLDLVDLYLEFGADINVARADGWTALHIACEIGDEESVLLLLQRGAATEVQSKVDGWSPLHVAARHGFKACVEALGLAGADLNIQSDMSGFTPVMVAVLGGHFDTVVSFLLVSNDPLRRCQPDLQPVDLSLRDGDGFSAFDLAELRRFQDIADLLRSNSAPGVGAIDLSSFTKWKRAAGLSRVQT